jgi:hypothetical protein
MTSIPRLDTLAGLAAFTCALAVFLAAALDVPDAAASPAAAAATRAAP